MLSVVLKGIVAKTAETNDYIKRRSKEIALEAELRAAKARQDIVKMRKLDNEIRSIQDSCKRMSIWPLIEAGEFSAISNGKVNADFAHFATAMYGEFSAISNGKVNTHDLAIADGQWTDWVEAQLQKLPRGFQTAARYGLITRDTALFQGLAQSIQYGDFVVRAVLYDNLTQMKKQSQKAALATVNETFINYNRLAGRDRQYLESVGLLWFYNFKMRIMKEAVYMLRHNPIRSLMMTVAPIGSPISDNLGTLLLEDRLGFSVGPAMGWNSPSLNPWLNLTR